MAVCEMRWEWNGMAMEQQWNGTGVEWVMV